MFRQIHIHDQFIRDNYLTMPAKRIAKEINRSGCYVFNRLKNLGLVVPVEIIEQRKAESRFKQGTPSKNITNGHISYYG